MVATNRARIDRRTASRLMVHRFKVDRGFPSVDDMPRLAHDGGMEIREVLEEDIGTFYEIQSDPEGIAMAAFTPRRDREAHLAHWRTTSWRSRRRSRERSPLTER